MTRVRGRAASVVALLLITVACGNQRPLSPSNAVPTHTTAISPSASVQESAGLSPGEVPIDVHDIPSVFTTPALAYETDGVRLIWSSGATGGPEQTAADLWAWLPREGEPQPVFVNPHRDSSLPIIRGDGHDHYTYVEQNAAVLGPVGWRLWYLPGPGAQPELLDEGDVDAGLLPFPTMGVDRVIWSSLHQTQAGVQSQLMEWRPGDREPSVLDQADAEDREFLYPSLAGELVSYTTIEVDPARGGLSSSVWLRDLSEGDAPPTRVSGEQQAFMAVQGEGLIVWLSPTTDNPFNGGNPVTYDLESKETEFIDLGGPVTSLTVGRRYVVGESENVGRLFAYDLSAGQRVLLDQASVGPPGSRSGVDVRPRVGGDLLVFVRGSDLPDVDLILKWASLPVKAATAQ